MRPALPAGAAELPVAAQAAEILEALAADDVLLEAPPGTGKTTVIPLALLLSGEFPGKILLLEPRRVAARAACRRMAALLGETPGERVGYRTRLDTLVSSRTVIEVVTEGVFDRIIQGDPSLEGYGTVIFDECHERSLQTDLGFVLALEAKSGLRPDLHLLLMSATLDPALLKACPGLRFLQVPGVMHPVALDYLPPAYGEPLEKTAARGVRRLLDREPSGDILVFLPGVGEIGRTERELEGLSAAGIAVLPLHGQLAREEQDRVLSPGTGRRVILSTSLAESSLTVPGVRHVVDAGLSRTSVFDLGTGLTALVTRKADLSSLAQRAGRAGRLGPGSCLRLFERLEESRRPEAREPEILSADLSSLALTLAVWGERDWRRLRWLTPPPAAAMDKARELLSSLGALDREGLATRKGRAMEAFPMHPRLSAMLLRAKREGCCRSAALAAACLENPEVTGRRRPVLLQELLHESGERLRGAGERAFRQALGLLGEREDRRPADWGRLLSWAYPDRIARRRGGASQGDSLWLLQNGRGAVLEQGAGLGEAEYLVAADLEGGGDNARIRLAAPLSREDLWQDFSDQFRREETVEWHEKRAKALSRTILKFGALPVKEEEGQGVSELQTGLLLRRIREEELRPLEFSPEEEVFCLRAQSARHFLGEDWPAFDRESLLASLEEWLLPSLAGLCSFQDLKSVKVLQALHRRLAPGQLQELEREFPTHYRLPGGYSARVLYDDPERPLLSARVQDLFGLCHNPKIAHGRAVLAVQLLSPAQRPVQTTSDMEGFWRNSYPLLRKELKGRYPKHDWPEEPTLADASRRHKKC